METAGNASNEETLAALEAKVQELEECLNKTRASAVVLRARILAEGLSNIGTHGSHLLPTATAGEPFPFTTGKEPDTAEEQVTPLPNITLAPLPVQHTLRSKWKLEKDFPHPSKEDQEHDEPTTRSDATHEGRLRLFGLLADGSPWECHLLYSDLMEDSGITIGRDGKAANIMLSDPSISRCHVRLELTDDGVVVSDESSMNGTFINGVRLGAYARQTPLKDGDVLGVAEMELKAELL